MPAIRRSRRRAPNFRIDRGGEIAVTPGGGGRRGDAAARRGGRDPHGTRSGDGPARSPDGSACRATRRPWPRRAARLVIGCSVRRCRFQLRQLVGELRGHRRQPALECGDLLGDGVTTRLVATALSGSTVGASSNCLTPFVVALQRLVGPADLRLDAIEVLGTWGGPTEDAPCGSEPTRRRLVRTSAPSV